MFKERLDELMRTKGFKDIDEALFEMRTGGNSDDIALLAAMGEPSSHHRMEKLKEEKSLAEMHRLAEENARGLKPAPEVKAALKAANAREIAFNVRMDELLDEGFSFDQAILQMRAKGKDAVLLAAMGAA